MKLTAIALSLLALGLAASPSFADTGFDNTTQNVIPGPLEDTPANPAANDSAAARVTTTHDGVKIKHEGKVKPSSAKTEDNPLLKDGPLE